MGLASSRGTKIYYEAFGQGPSLLLVNGWGASGLGWESSFLEALSRDHRLVFLDNRGTGRSDKPDIEYTVPIMAEDCVAVLNAAEVDKADVLGVSMGGLIAQELALSCGGRVSSLILCCTSCGWKGRSTPLQRAFTRLFLRPEERLKLRMELLYSKDFVSKEWPRLKAQWHKASQYPTPLHTYRRQWRALMNYNCCERLPQLKAPTLVMGGDADRLNPLERLMQLAKQIPHAELQVFPGLGHGFIVEAREDVVKHVLAFLGR